MIEETKSDDIVPENNYPVPETDKIFVKGVGILSQEDIKREMEDEIIGGVFVGRNFTMADLEKIQEEASFLRRNNLTNSEELSAYHDTMIQRIERKLKIREAFKNKTV